MRTKRYLYLTLIVSSCVCGGTQQNSDPKQIIEGLRRQMKELETLKARYTVNTTYGLSGPHAQFKVSYIKSKDKYNMSEYRYDSGDQIEETRTVYDGIQIKVFHQIEKDNIKQGMTLPKDWHEILYSRNDIRRLTGFNIINLRFEKNLDNYAYKNMGTEIINGQNCVKIVMIMPYKPEQKAYTYRWIKIQDQKYYLTKIMCLIDDDPNQLLFEKQYKYDSSDTYPFPREIYYERYEIDDHGNRNPYFKSSIVVEDLEINVPVDDSEFVYFFPEGTVVNTLPATIDPKEIVDPNQPKGVKKRKPTFKVEEVVTDQRTEFPIGGGSGAILIPIKIGGQEYSFVLDTGSSHTVFDTSLRDKLGKPKRIIKMPTSGNPVVVQTFESPAFSVGPFNLNSGNEIFCFDLRMLSLIDGRQISGVLGMDFLKHHVIQIDFDKVRLAFLQKIEASSISLGQDFEIIYHQRGSTQIRGKILGQLDVDFMIDSGNNSTGNLDSGTFAVLLGKNNVQVSEALVSTPSGLVKKRQVRVGSLTIGPFKYRDLIFGEGNFNSLGLDFLSRHLVTFDFPKGRIYLKKGSQFNKIDEEDMSGLHLLRISGKTVVHIVDEASPAGNAGIIAGDIIVKVEGKEAQSYDMGQLRQLLKSEDGRSITMTIQRDDDLKKVVFVLKKKV